MLQLLPQSFVVVSSSSPDWLPQPARHRLSAFGQYSGRGPVNPPNQGAPGAHATAKSTVSVYRVMLRCSGLFDECAA
jgi:hypothetical protein